MFFGGQRNNFFNWDKWTPRECIQCLYDIVKQYDYENTFLYMAQYIIYSLIRQVHKYAKEYEQTSHNMTKSKSMEKHVNMYIDLANTMKSKQYDYTFMNWLSMFESNNIQHLLTNRLCMNKKIICNNLHMNIRVSCIPPKNIQIARKVEENESRLPPKKKQRLMYHKM